MPSFLVKFFCVLSLLSGLQATAQTYDINDRPIEQMMQQRQTWNNDLAKLFTQIEKNRDWYCHFEDLACIEGALVDSEKMHSALTVLVNEWEPLFNQTYQILSLFSNLEVPTRAHKTRQQYQTYLYILRTAAPDEHDLIAYSMGKLGYLANYQATYEIEQGLADIARRQMEMLEELRYLAVIQIKREKRFLRSL